jgi:hypothetical protein
MLMSLFDADFFVPIMIFAVPLVAIVGGISFAIVKTVSRHRLIEMAQRERIAAIERGVDPSKLPPLPEVLISAEREDLGHYSSGQPLRHAQGLMTGGLVTLAVGVALAIFLEFVAGEPGVWAVGLIPGLVGVALLISAAIVWPRHGGGASGPPMR